MTRRTPFPRHPARILGLALALGSLSAPAGAVGEPPALYRQIAAQHHLSADALYRQALRASGRASRYGTTRTPWPWTVRLCAEERCETVYPDRRTDMAAVLAAGRAAGLLLYVGPLGLRWDATSALPLRAATSPRVTINEAARQWAAASSVPDPPPPTASAAPPHAVTLPFATAQARRWTPLINRVAREEGVDPAWVHSVIAAESAYNPTACSPKGAVGLMQLMPATAERFGLARTDRHRPEPNLRAGIRYLRWLMTTFDHDPRLALAGYNAGEGAVLQYGRQIPPYPETQTYVRRVLRYHAQYRAAVGASS